MSVIPDSIICIILSAELTIFIYVLFIHSLTSALLVKYLVRRKTTPSITFNFSVNL